MNKKAIITTALPAALLPAAAVILEALPYGAVLNFAPGPGETIRQTFSYFSLIPFGYANFGPFMTAALTCVILLLAVINIFADNRRLCKTTAVFSAVAFIISLMPLMFGLDYFTVIGAAISAILAAEFFLAAFIGRGKPSLPHENYGSEE